MAKEVSYKAEEAGKRLDVFLVTYQPELSRSHIQKLIDQGAVLVDGQVRKANYKLRGGETVSLVIPEVEPVSVEPENIPLDVLYEDKDIIVINKPSGLLSIASDNEKRSTAYRILSDYVQQKDKHNRVFVVHRLDEDTSGVLMIAKDKVTQEKYQDNWNDLVSKRGYYAIVDGILDKKQGTITSYLKKNAQNMMYSSKKSGDGQSSVTHYKVIKEKDN